MIRRYVPRNDIMFRRTWDKKRCEESEIDSRHADGRAEWSGGGTTERLTKQPEREGDREGER